MQAVMRRKLIFSGECTLLLGLLEVKKVYWNITKILWGIDKFGKNVIGVHLAMVRYNRV